jgi:aminoglycoside phosphotransferase (APT) family kinase protein
MHLNEFQIDEFLVSKLIGEQFPDLSHLPLKRVISNGTDNALFRLGSDMVVRLPRIDWAVENVDKEFNWLSKIAPFLQAHIPTPLKKGSPTIEYPHPWSIYSWIEGSNPKPTDVTESLIQEIASFINALHKIDLPNGPISNRGVPLKERDKETRKAIDDLEEKIDTKTVRKIWEDALKIPEWSKPSVWVHGDLSSGNLLIKNDHLAAVIDFGNLGTGDPACDLIIAWNLFPAHLRDLFRSKLEVDDATWKRGMGWALSIALIQLPYYKDTNPSLANNARHVIKEIIG